MAEPLRVAILGCGGIAQAYLQALGRTPALRLCAAVDSDPARAKAVADATGATAFPDLAGMFAAGVQPDVALVLTPPNTHEALATRLLESGVHVLCEKPLTTSTAAAERMLAAARQAGRLLTMGSKFRYTPDVARARQLLQEGTIGQVLMFENVFCSRVDMTRRWNAQRSIAGGGVLIDNGSHAVDIARFLLGPIARVQAQFGKRVQPLEVEDTARILFEAKNGAMGSIDLSWSLHKELPAYVSLHGSEGSIEVGWRVSRFKRQGDKEWTVFGNGYDKISSFAAQLQDLANALHNGASPVINEIDALASVQVIDAAYHSASEHKWHEIV